MRPKLVLFGDSITEEAFADGGWVAALANHLSRSGDVLLRGYSGYNTRWALKVLDRAMEGVAAEGEQPMAVTVFFGANDAVLADRTSAFQHVPLEEYADNLRAICGSLKKRWPKTVVILITPPPIDEQGRIENPYIDNETGLPERTNEQAGAYAKACVAVAKESGISVIDMWSKMQHYPNWGKAFLRDGLHFTNCGNRVLFNEVVRTLRQHGLSLETIPADLPLLYDLDRDDPLKAFIN